jgi:hypothetical protein
MSANRMSVAIAAALSLLAASAVTAAAESRSHVRQFSAKPAYQTARFANAGDWRHRVVRGWDHSCVNVPWLTNMFACSAK